MYILLSPNIVVDSNGVAAYSRVYFSTIYVVYLRNWLYCTRVYLRNAITLLGQMNLFQFSTRCKIGPCLNRTGELWPPSTSMFGNRCIRLILMFACCPFTLFIFYKQFYYILFSPNFFFIHFSFILHCSLLLACQFKIVLLLTWDLQFRKKPIFLSIILYGTWSRS